MENSLSVVEAAEKLNVKRDTLKSRIRRGQIPAQKDDHGNWRIAERHIRHILNWGKPFDVVMRNLKRQGTDPLSCYS